jgi:outer membrane protein assembly factor BamB
MDRERKGHLMLFDQDGNLLWEHQIEEWIETVAVSTGGYVIAGPRDRYIYVYDCTGKLIFSHYAENNYDIQDVVIAPDESYFLFGSERSYLNCYTFEGDLLWKQEAGPLSNIRISADGEYIVVGTANSRLLLFDRHGTNLWDTKVTDAFFIEEVAISDHAEYIAINTQERLFLPTLYLDVYNREGQLLWRYEGNQPFMAIAISGDGHYIAAGNQNTLVSFDNFQAIEEYAQSECAQPTSLMIC